MYTHRSLLFIIYLKKQNKKTMHELGLLKRNFEIVLDSIFRSSFVYSASCLILDFREKKKDNLTQIPCICIIKDHLLKSAVINTTFIYSFIYFFFKKRRRIRESRLSCQIFPETGRSIWYLIPFWSMFAPKQGIRKQDLWEIELV